MKNIFLPLLLIFSTFFSLPAFSSSWRMHPTFDEKVERVIETPNYVYFTSYTLPQMSSKENYQSLFRYDKDGDELRALSTDNILASNNIRTIEYCPEKKYLIVVHSNSDIDLLFDDGTVKNIPDYRLSGSGLSKGVNSVSIDPANDRFYLATDFGYVAINDKKYEIAESRIYGTPLTSFMRINDTYLALKNDQLMAAPVDAQRSSLGDYDTVLEFSSPFLMTPLGSHRGILISYDENSHQVWLLEEEEGKIKADKKMRGSFYNVENNKNGVTVSGADYFYQFNKNGVASSTKVPEEFWRISRSSYDMTELWNGQMRKGLSGLKKSGDSWTLSTEFTLPDSPSPFISTNMEMHPSLGLIIANYGWDTNLTDTYPHSSPILLSSLKKQRWTNHSQAYTYPELEKVMTSPNGFAIDPDNSNLIYFGSRDGGIARLNLSDPSEVIHLSYPEDPTSKLPGFYGWLQKQPSSFNYFTFSAPRFDSRGNLWISHYNKDDQNPPALHLYCWTPEDRKATTASNVIPPTLLKVKGLSPASLGIIVPLKYSSQRNLLVYANRNSKETMAVINHNGTPLSDSDDQVVIINTFTDQDGNTIEAYNIKCIWEDPATGLVWVGHKNGVFYLNPLNVLAGDKRIYRVKVSRNDGTNLADYLLDGVSVNSIASDSQNRKWFATSGGGVICTSSDGREILRELNTSDTPIPSDIVFGIAYNPENNSLMLSTEKGLAEYFISGDSEGTENSDVKAYPNPVRPGYMGYVTIEGLPEGSLVKIVDASGNLVKEIGYTGSGEVQWDVTNHFFKRVNSGVYYILVSSSNSDSSFATAGKILVVN